MDLRPELRGRIDDLLAEIGAERLPDSRVSLPMSTLHALLVLAGRGEAYDLMEAKPKGHC